MRKNQTKTFETSEREGSFAEALVCAQNEMKNNAETEIMLWPQSLSRTHDDLSLYQAVQKHVFILQL